MRREEIVGREGGFPPILLRFTDDDGRFLGLYVKLHGERPELVGPMFKAR